MKKLLAVIVAVAAGALIFSKVRASRNESDLWHEATTTAEPGIPAAPVERVASRSARGRSSIGRAPPLQGGG